jgi:hypothetical protein
MADKYIYENGVLNDDTSRYFTSKVWNYLLDQNGGNYSNNQIQINASSISNNYVNWSEAFLTIPIVTSINSSADLGAGGNTGCDFLVGLKSGFWNIINSMTCQINSKDMLNLTSLINQYISFQAVTEFTRNDLLLLGDLLGFQPDTAGSVEWSDDAGVMNSKTTGSVNMTERYKKGAAFNEGFVKRLLSSGYRQSSSVINALVDQQDLNSTLKSFTSGVADTRKQWWFCEAVIRLKDIADLFTQLNFPVKNLSCIFYINLNQGSARITAGTGLNVTSNVSLSGSTMPCLVNTDALINANIGNANATVDVFVGVAKANNYSGPQTSCRLYYPIYEMNPLKEQEYLANPVKRVFYKDVTSYQVPGATSTVNQVISNGIVKPKRLIVIPSFSANSSVSGVVGMSSLTNPSPSTVDPCFLSQININLGGKSLFPNQLNYDYEFFLQQMLPNTTLGALETGMLSSGLISKEDWFYNYRYYVFDLSRHRKEIESAPISIQFQGTNMIGLPIDLNFFIEYEREFSINKLTGEILLLQ